MPVALTLTQLKFKSSTLKKQLVDVYIRVTADPDIPASYILVVANAEVSGGTGNFLPPVVIPGLLENTSYTVKVVNVNIDGCAGQVFKKVFLSVYETRLTSISYSSLNGGGATTPVTNTLATLPATVTSPGVISSNGLATVNVTFSVPFTEDLVWADYTVPAGLVITNAVHNLVTGNWDITANFTGLAANVFVIEPPAAYTAVFNFVDDGTYDHQGNSSLASVNKTAPWVLTYYSKPTVQFVLTLPASAPNIFGLPDSNRVGKSDLLSYNIGRTSLGVDVPLSNVYSGLNPDCVILYDAGLDKWLVTVTMPGTSNHLVGVQHQNFVTVISIGGVKYTNWQNVNYLQGLFYFENALPESPLNEGFGYYQVRTCRIVINRWPIPANSPNKIFLEDYIVPAGVTLHSATVINAGGVDYYQVDISWLGPLDPSVPYLPGFVFDFAIIPSFVTTLTYGYFIGNTQQAATPQTMNSSDPDVEKGTNLQLKYYAQPGPIPIELVLPNPASGYEVGDTIPWDLSPNITVIGSPVYNPVDDAYHVSGTIPGNISQTIVVNRPSNVAAFDLDHTDPTFVDKTHRMITPSNFPDFDIIEGAFYFEFLATGSEQYNWGVGYWKCNTVKIRAKKVVVLGNGSFAADYNLPAGLSVIGLPAIIGGFWVVEFSFSGLTSQQFNLTSNPL